MAQKPSEPQALSTDKAGKAPGFDRWLFLFYKWVASKVESLLDTDFLVKTANGDLTAERVVTDTTSIVWDWSTTGQAKANVQTEFVQDAVGAMVDATLVYVDATPLLTRGAITGDVSIPQASNTATLATVNSNVGSFGSASTVATFTVNAKGLITAAADTPISITSAAVSDFTEAAQDAVGGALTDSSSVDFTYNDGAGTITAVVLPAGVDHGGLAGLADDDHTQYVLNNGTRTAITLAAASGDYVQIGGGAAASELRFLEPSGSGSNYTAFKAQAQAGNVTYTLPAADAAGVLTSDGSGNLSWGAGGGTSFLADGHAMAFAARH